MSRRARPADRDNDVQCCRASHAWGSGGRRLRAGRKPATPGGASNARRADQGRPGLLGVHCSHRLVSLAYGRPEDGGLRCPMHGWLYNIERHCLDQPAEPDETFKDRIQHLAYPCQDMGGLIFAYMGPKEKMPLLPRYEALVREDGNRQVTWWPIDGNYLQHLEGAWDNIHAGF